MGTTRQITLTETTEKRTFLGSLQKTRALVSFYVTSKKREIRWAFLILLSLGYAIYFGYAVYYKVKENTALIVITCLVAAILVLRQFIIRFGEKISNRLSNLTAKLPPKVQRWGKSVLYILIVLGVAIFIAVDSRSDPHRLISGAGLITILVLAFIVSTGHDKVDWKVVLSGITLQLVIGLVILRWQPGYAALNFLGQQVSLFLSYANSGAQFVFGEKYGDHPMAFKSMPVTIYFGAVSAILYYIGAMQAAIRIIGWIIRKIVGTSTAESFVAAANIFLGPSESVLMIAPLMAEMTTCQLHTILTCGFGTIAGAVMAIYISFGIPATHLMTASVMSSPAALAVSKILHPEKEAVSKKERKLQFTKSEAISIFDAARLGARGCIKVVGYIISNMLAFTAVIQFLNATLGWFGDRVGWKGLTFQVLISYLVYPLVFLMGVEPADCLKVGELVGLGIFVNSFFSYVELAKLINNRLNGLKPSISRRSEIIATYAVCNFANFGSVGMNLGTMGALAPMRKADLARVALRALVGGNMASFMTACIAGLLYQG